MTEEVKARPNATCSNVTDQGLPRTVHAQQPIAMSMATALYVFAVKGWLK